MYGNHFAEKEVVITDGLDANDAAFYVDRTLCLCQVGLGHRLSDPTRLCSPAGGMRSHLLWDVSQLAEAGVV
jgi:hypothetical protein